MPVYTNYIDFDTYERSGYNRDVYKRQPPVSLLQKGSSKTMGDTKAHLQETANKLQQTLKNFGVNVTITNVSCGPSVTRYELQPEMGVKVSKIVNLADDIKLNPVSYTHLDVYTRQTMHRRSRQRTMERDWMDF